ncbi:MAG: right-handed parallel beta-helix repeat-containing protein [Gemmatimonadota bacterium]
MRVRSYLVAISVAAAPVEARAAQAPPSDARLETIALRAGLVITKSVRIRGGTYRFPAPASLDSAVITIRGHDITVDFDGARLDGTGASDEPDQAGGVAILIDGGRNIRLVRARIRGYRVGILARGTERLTLEDNQVNDTWKPRLFSLVEHESLVDWLSFHHNEKDEWLRFGAGIYLAGVEGGVVRGNRGEGGMNGLLLTATKHLRIEGNSFSFNSGLGIGLYRSSDNQIVGNRLDYNVRGYSHRFYRRGQDSAGLLIFDESSRNVVALNSVTHGGDGLFLWAGQHTMDTGEGGANDNLIFGNDFSFAPTNGMEATFSRNRFIANRIEGSDHGLWGGYSYGSTVAGNCFIRNRIGIAIEHGQNNVIASNRFDGDSTAISLWADPIEPSDWGYPKHRDTRSGEYRIDGNRMNGNRTGLRIKRTTDLTVVNNRPAAVDSFAVLSDTALATVADNSTGAGRDREDCVPMTAKYRSLVPDDARLTGEIPGSPLARLDRSAIVVDEWGPYDWRSPKLWPLDSTRAVPARLRVLGPPGRWRVLRRSGVAAVSKETGQVGDTISVTPERDSAANWEVTLEYRGGAVVSARGERSAAGWPYEFAYGRFEPATDWAVRFFTWSGAEPPADGIPAGAKAVLTRSASRLDYQWSTPPIAGLPGERWALEARAAVTLGPGGYTLQTISDDGVRVWVDGVLTIDHWDAHESAVDSAPLASGKHDLRVEYYQVDGWTELRVEIFKGSRRSPGSPGLH